MRNLATTFALAALVLMTTPAAAIGGGGPSETPANCACAQAFADALADANADGADQAAEDARKARNLAERDLQAQFGMERAAREMIGLTWAHLVLTLFSLAGLGATVFFTRRSLDHARTELNESRDFQHKALRAYLSIEGYDADLEPGDDDEPAVANFSVGIWNRGQTTARNVVVRSTIQLVRCRAPEAQWIALDWSADVQRYGIIQPGAKATTTASLLIGGVDMAELSRRTACVAMQVEAYYQDVFGSWHRRRSMLAMTGGELEDNDLPLSGNEEVALAPDFKLPFSLSKSDP